MSTVLVVGDSQQDTERLQQLVATAGFDGLAVASDAVPHLDCRPSMILWDQRVIPDKTTLEDWSNEIPVVVVTDEGNDVGTKKALEAGIAGCLPWDRVAVDLKRTVKAILDSASRDDLSVDDAWSMCYTIDNNPELLPLVVGEIRRRISGWEFRDPIELVRVTVALSESLDNALYHGNLELSSDLRQGDGLAWRDESLRRRKVPPYSHRRIRIQGTIGREEARFMVSDEGQGFDTASLRDCTEAGNLELCSGRGLLLMRMYMDDVVYNDTGNEVTLVKRRPS